MSDAFHIIVKFGSGYTSDMQGPILLAWEKALREQGIPAEMYKETKPDDSKLRQAMALKMKGK